jgi:hypothetical protein
LVFVEGLVRLLLTYWAIVLAVPILMVAFVLHWVVGVLFLVFLGIGVAGSLAARRRQARRATPG